MKRSGKPSSTVLVEREAARKEMQRSRVRRALQTAAEERGRGGPPPRAATDRAHALEELQRGRAAKALLAARRAAQRAT